MQSKILSQRYELEEKIGDGGMAAVYRGRDLRLNRVVAIKILHPHHAADLNFLKRFIHEAQSAANLRHPSIVDIYDEGEEERQHYIVMEFVDGSDLKSMILRYKQLPVQQVLQIAAAIADGLDAAHQLGMVHRDVKPQNILVTHDGTAKITDFGIAKSSLSTAQTDTGVTFGTADYISPEQARGQPATAKSDIYALGVTIYESLTGQLPFTGDTAVAVALQHVGSKPPPIR
ncbi:MAG: serine/threonine protein kinase, partial [Chloroflexi bacterium]|nr:serine/threonine protein kinase [Chloroflexota bacterium]